jgi:hypothetical protein
MGCQIELQKPAPGKTTFISMPPNPIHSKNESIYSFYSIGYKKSAKKPTCLM